MQISFQSLFDAHFEINSTMKMNQTVNETNQ